MAEKATDYEKVSIYRLDEATQEKLLSTHRECVFNWSTRDGWPMGVIMSYLWQDGRFWLTAGAHRHRISAVRRDPRVSIVVTSTGTELGGGKTVTAKGRCVVHEDRETKDWFYQAFANHLNPDPKASADFQKMLDSPLRVVLEVIPEKYITYDGAKMFMHAAGKISEEELSPPLNSDTERLERELERRGLK
jgi:general stress protein 26